MTKIEWADDTENLATGCTEARLADGSMDPACVNCYARLMSARLKAMGAGLYEGVAERAGGGARWTGVFRWDADMLRRKFDRMRGGRRVFLGSMTDLWHEKHDPALLVALAVEIRRMDQRPPERRPNLIMLTKHAGRLLAWQREHFPEGLPAWVWVGVTAGCQEAADERIPVLLQVVTAGPRVVSVEPMTGAVDLRFCSCEVCCSGDHPGDCATCAGWGSYTDDTDDVPKSVDCADCGGDGECRGCGGARAEARIGWVICGGESGPKARPMHPEWARSLRDQCVSAGVPFFFKQFGEFLPTPDISEGDAVVNGLHMTRVGKRAAGRLLDGRTWDEVPE